MSNLQRFVPSWLRNGWGLAAFIAGAYIVVYAVWTRFLWDGNERLIWNLVFLPMGLFAVVAAWGRVAFNLTLSRHFRQAWLILGAACGALFVGDLLYAVIELVLKLDPTEYYFSDFIYLAFYPLVVWGLLRLPGMTPTGDGRWRLLLDLGVVMTVATMGIWYFIINPLAQANQHSDWITRLLIMAFPIGDLVALAGVVAVFFRRPEVATRSSLALFSLGLLGFVGHDFFNIYTSLRELEVGYGPSLIWLTAYWLFALAALRQPYLMRGSVTEQWLERVIRAGAAALPFVAIIVGYGFVLGIVLVEPGRVPRGLLAGAGVLTALVIGRQMLVVRENARLTQELIAQSADLERRVQKRSRELQRSQAQLLASQRLASVGALAAGVVHEISNPLNTIITVGETLEAQVESGAPDLEALRTYVPVINRAAWHGARVMQALRQYSRGVTPEFAPCDLADIVEDALLLIGHSLRTGALTQVQLRLEPDLPRLVCDRHQLIQVLINLLRNAREAMPNGGVVDLQVRHLGESVVFEVRDQGLGIADEAREKIFDPFYTTKSADAGAGLGLSIVAGIVHAHRGTIEVQSAGAGQGATFIVTLPVRPKPITRPINLTEESTDPKSL